MRGIEVPGRFEDVKHSELKFRPQHGDPHLLESRGQPPKSVNPRTHKAKSANLNPFLEEDNGSSCEAYPFSSVAGTPAGFAAAGRSPLPQGWGSGFRPFRTQGLGFGGYARIQLKKPLRITQEADSGIHRVQGSGCVYIPQRTVDKERGPWVRMTCSYMCL